MNVRKQRMLYSFSKCGPKGFEGTEDPATIEGRLLELATSSYIILLMSSYLLPLKLARYRNTQDDNAELSQIE
jgi:hypothetical protein